jgi:hypothetical protein
MLCLIWRAQENENCPMPKGFSLQAILNECMAEAWQMAGVI